MSADRVVLAEAQPAMRASLRSVLETDGFVVCGEAADRGAAVEAVEACKPDVCLIEILLPGGGLHALHEIADRSPTTAVIVLTNSDQGDDLFDALRAGARGYLLKSMDPARLPLAIRGVLRGEAAIPRDLVAALVRELQTRGHGRSLVGNRGRVDLSGREWEVLDLLTDGANTAAIAERLFVSPVTVRRHISSVVAKLGASGREDARQMVAAAAQRRTGDGG